MRFHKIQKPKIPKHLAFESDLVERSEEICASENKSFNELVNEAVRFRIETKDKAEVENKDAIPQSKSQSHGHLTLSEADHLIKEQIIPLVDKHDLITIEDKDTFVSLSKFSKRLVETVDVKLNRKKRIELHHISYLNPFERERQRGLKIAREMREKNERVELMSALPRPFEVMMDVRVESEGLTRLTELNTALTTSSTARTDLTEAEWLALKSQAEERDKRLEALKKEMRTQAKDSVKVIDESQEIPTEDESNYIRISSADGDDGVNEDDSENVPQEEY